MSTIYLCAPFRTFLSVSKNKINSEEKYFIAYTDRIIKAQYALSASIPACRNISKNNKKSLLYSTLEDDNAKSSFKPIIEIHVNVSDVWENLSSCLSEELGLWFKKDSFKCDIGLYDNTIGILEVYAQTENSIHELGIEKARKLDELTTLFCCEVVALFNKKLDKLINSLVENQGKYSFYYPKKKFVAFSDVINYIDSNADRVLWVGRTLFTESDASDHEFYNAWLDKELLGEYSFNSGNSLVNSYFSIDDVARSTVVCQYFNAALTIINVNLDVINTLDDGFDKEYTKVSLMKSQVELFDIEEMSVKNGLQGKRREICNEIISAWHHDELKFLVRKRIELIGTRLEEVHAKKIRRYSSVMEALLAFIGAVTLVDVFVSLFIYTEVGYKAEYSWGVLSLIRNSQPDSLISLLVVVSIIFGVLYVRKSRG